MRSRLTAAACLLLVLVGCKKSEAPPLEGHELFVFACARCHGASGGGGAPLYSGGPSPRNFHDHAFQESRTDEELKTVIRAGKGRAMPPFGSMFDEHQLASLVVEIRKFDPAKTR